MKDFKYSILINKTSKQFDERGFECMLAIFLGMMTLFLLFLFPIAGIALGAIASCFLCVGIKSYLISVCEDKFIPIESIFSSWRITIKAFCLKVASCLLFLLWSLVFIVPGIVTALNYSLASFILAEDNSLDAFSCMIKSKKMVEGYRVTIFIFYLAYALVTLVALSIFGAIGAAIIQYFNPPVWIPITCMVVGFLFVFIIFIVPYFELGLTNIYLGIKYDKNKIAKPRATRARTSIKVENTQSN